MGEHTPEYDTEVKGVSRKVTVDGSGEVSFYYTTYGDSYLGGPSEETLYVDIDELENILAAAKEHAYAYQKFVEADYADSEYHKAVVLYRLTGGKCE
jgi:hypothetical protein